MPYDEELTPYADAFEPSPELDELIRRVIGRRSKYAASLAPALSKKHMKMRSPLS